MRCLTRASHCTLKKQGRRTACAFRTKFIDKQRGLFPCCSGWHGLNSVHWSGWRADPPRSRPCGLSLRTRMANLSRPLTGSLLGARAWGSKLHVRAASAAWPNSVPGRIAMAPGSGAPTTQKPTRDGKTKRGTAARIRYLVDNGLSKSQLPRQRDRGSLAGSAALCCTSPQA